MPVYFVTQTINDSLRNGRLSTALGGVNVDAFLIKVGASRDGQTVLARKEDYESQQGGGGVTFIHNDNLPFSAAKKIERVTFQILLEGRRVGGTSETYMIIKDTDNVPTNVPNLRDALQAKMADWDGINVTVAQNVGNYLKELMGIFVNYGFSESKLDECEAGIDELLADYQEVRGGTTTGDEEPGAWGR
ncbi:hypothetical protein FRC09_001978 [Ceratobasidium sp. 395]|nr:hypothetical protein FRC09_001978 [Ceratobasidium sp. 395]